MANAAEIKTAADTGITGFSGQGMTLIRFDTSKAEARAAIMASMDRLAAGAIIPRAPTPIPAELLADVRARMADAPEALIEVEARISMAFFGGRAR